MIRYVTVGYEDPALKRLLGEREGLRIVLWAFLPTLLALSAAVLVTILAGSVQREGTQGEGLFAAAAELEAHQITPTVAAPTATPTARDTITV